MGDPPTLEGWMVKQNPRKMGNMVTWKRRYFRVEGQRLGYYKDYKPNQKCLGFIPLSSITSVEKAMFPKVPEKRHVNCGLAINTVGGRVYNLLTDNSEDRDNWVRVLPKIMAYWKRFGGEDVPADEPAVQDDGENSLDALDVDNTEGDVLVSKYDLEASSDEEDGGSGSGSSVGSPPRFSGGGGSNSNGSSPAPAVTFSSGNGGFVHEDMPASRTSSMSSNIVSAYSVEDDPEVNGGAYSPPANGRMEDSSGSGYRRRSAALSTLREERAGSNTSTGSPLSSSPAAADTNGMRPTSTSMVNASGNLGSQGAIKVWLDDGQHNSYVLPRGATIGSLHQKIAGSLPAELQNDVQLWCMTSVGVPQLLQPEQDPFAIKRSGQQVFLLSPERCLVALFFEDGSFVPAVLAFDVTADQICQGSVPAPALADKILDIGDPGLFLRRQGHRDQLFHSSDRPIDSLYDGTSGDEPSGRALKPDMADCKLVIKSRSLRPQTVEVMPTAAPAFHSGEAARAPAGNDNGPDLRSFLWKKGLRNTGWKKRWCTFQGGIVRYYRSLSDRDPAGQFQAADIELVEEMPDARDRRYAFTFRVATNNGRDYLFCAETQSLMLQWISALQTFVTKADKCGFLLKKGFKNRAWKRRWCVLKGTELQYFENQDDRVRRGDVDLETASQIIPAENSDHEFEFQIFCGERTYRFRAASLQEMNEWIRALRGLETRQPASEPVFREATAEPVFASEPSFSAPQPSFTPNGHQSPVFASSNNNSEPLTQFAPSGGYSYRNEFDGSTEFYSPAARNRSSTLPVQQAKAEPLPQPVIDPQESASASFTYSEEQWESFKTKKETKLSAALESALSDESSVLTPSKTPFGEAPPSSLELTERGNELEGLRSKAAADRSGSTPRQLTDDVRKRLGITKPKLEANVPNPEVATAGKAVVVPTPSVLKIVMLQHAKGGDSGQGQMKRISLSGVVLQCVGGSWRKDDVCQWHSEMPGDDAPCEVFQLPPNIVAKFHQDEKRWFVRPAGGAEAPARAEPQRSPEVQAWIALGGMQFVSGVHSAVESVLQHYAEHGVGLEPEEKLTLLDDSIHEDVGVLVRSRLCSAFAEIFAHGLLPTRLGGLVKNTIWSVVMGGSGRPNSKTSAAGISAHRVTQDLSSNPNMDGDDNIKFRTFICASLNHRFLEEWLGDLFRNRSLLRKFYAPGAFLLTCPPTVFDELLLGLQPLMVLPFRLHSSFEITRKMSLMRKLSTRGATAPARARTATAPASNRIRRQKLPMVKALYSNTAGDEDELSFNKGDVLEVEMRVSDDWLLCLLNGERGLVPHNYVQPYDPSSRAAFDDTEC